VIYQPIFVRANDQVTPLLLKTKASRATVLPQRGGLVSSLYLGSAGRDLLWLPQNFDETASSWPGGGLPLLFPFAGRVWHQGELYRYKV
jgi:galactose mutarotase-like enzyme